MRFEDYPPQEPLTEIGKAYHAAISDRAPKEAPYEHQHGDDPYQSLAVFKADEPSGDVLIFGHGGGWTNGYKEWMAFMAPGLNAAGVTFVSIGYRLAPAHLFPAGVEDWVAGIAWVHQNIANFGGDPGRLFLGGHSAGGHYASLLAVRHDWQAGAGLPADVVRGCLPVSGVYDFEEGAGFSMRPRFLGESGNERDASPIHNIAGDLPAFLIVHGETDFPHLSAQAVRMEETLRGAGCDVRRTELEGCDHLGTSYATAEINGPWLSAVIPWMKSQKSASRKSA